ncbi:MAG: hypothetical protein J0L75_18330 [Spirochaetes bacterium]|nr:hypothetical protein [Spirochaetota bacterium]
MRSSLFAFLGATGASWIAAWLLQWAFTGGLSASPSAWVILAWAIGVLGASTVFLARLLATLPAYSVFAPIAGSFFRIFLVAGAGVVAVVRFPANAPLFCAVLGMGIALSLAFDLAFSPKGLIHGR